MDYYLDIAWEHIAKGIIMVGDLFFSLQQNLHILGPALLISILAACTVCFTKWLNTIVITQRYIALEKEYHHWFNLRQEALRCADKEKGRRLARNIDKAELNRAYYDYFFEGLLLGIVRKVLPIFFMFAFINEYYKPEQLIQFFGRDYVVEMTMITGEPLMIGAPFWFFLSLLGCYLLWPLGRWVGRRIKSSYISGSSNTAMQSQ